MQVGHHIRSKALGHAVGHPFLHLQGCFAVFDRFLSEYDPAATVVVGANFSFVVSAVLILSYYQHLMT